MTLARLPSAAIAPRDVCLSSFPLDGTNGLLSPDNDSCVDCAIILQELENIDDDTDRHGIKFVKTQVRGFLVI